MKRPAHEARRLRKVASDYEKDGYDVLVEPDPKELPRWLASFAPDLVGKSSDDQVIIEVKSHESVREDERLRLLADLVAQHPDWRLELVMTNPPWRAPSPEPGPLLSPGHVLEHLAAADELAARGFVQPSFLTAWTAFEAAGRNAMEHEGIDSFRTPMLSILKTLFSLGYLTDDDQVERLEQAWQVRNALAHGYAPDLPASPDAVRDLIALTRTILESSSTE